MRSNYHFISECMRTNHWSMHAGFFDYYRRKILHEKGTSLDTKEKEQAAPSILLFKNGVLDAEERLILTSHPNWYDTSYIKNTDQIINVIRLEGPITSGGAPCSYGTRELADMFAYADMRKSVIGHLVIINTPGGSARANELNELFENAKKPVVALIRSLCCSKGVEIASHIPHVFAESRDSEIGCIGTFASFSGIKSGTVVEGETYYEVYADQSTQKNYAYREAIQNDNLQPIIDELNELNDQFLANVRKRWPNVKDETLEGATYKAHEVEGQLFDGYKTYSEAIDYIFELAGVERLDSGVITPVGMVDDPDDDDLNQATINPIHNYTPMTNIEMLESVLGQGSVQVDENGNAQLTVDQMVQLNAHFERLNQEAEEAKRLVNTQAVTIANQQTIIAEQNESIEQMAEATTRGIAQHSPSNDLDLEGQQTQVVESALEGVNDPKEKWNIVTNLAKKAGLL